MKKIFEQDRAAANNTGCRSDAADGCGTQAGESNRPHRSESASTMVYVDAAPISRPSANPARYLDQLRGRARALMAARRRRELTLLLVAEWIAQRRAAQAHANVHAHVHAQFARDYGFELHAAQPHDPTLRANAELRDPDDDAFDAAALPEPQRTRRTH